MALNFALNIFKNAVQIIYHVNLLVHPRRGGGAEKKFKRVVHFFLQGLYLCIHAQVLGDRVGVFYSFLF